MPSRSRAAAPSLLDATPPPRVDLTAATIAASIEDVLSPTPSAGSLEKLADIATALRGGFGGVVKQVVVSFQTTQETQRHEQHRTELTEKWNSMAADTGAAKITAWKGRRLSALSARLAEPGWIETAVRAIEFLRSDWWYRQNPSAIRIDVLLRPGKAEEYVERSAVTRTDPSASSRGGARNEADAQIHEELNRGAGALRDVAYG